MRQQSKGPPSSSLACRYQSTISGSFQVVEIIETFVSYMESLERCVCIVYDITAAAGGALGLKAIRLSEKFVEAYREGDHHFLSRPLLCWAQPNRVAKKDTARAPLQAGSLTIEKIRAKGLSWRDVFVEIPITVHNSPMAAALAAEVAPPSAATTLDCERCAGDRCP